MCSIVVDQDEKLVATMLARKRPMMAGKAHNTCMQLEGVKATMKLPPFLSTFVLNKMCELIKNGVTEKGFKKVCLTNVAKKVFNNCHQEVSLQKVYNHLCKWRGR
jgi:hypothetical protein